MQVVLKGIPELRAKLIRLGSSLAAASSPATRAGAEIVGRAAKANVPVASGKLRDSIQVTEERRSMGASAEVSTDVEYAGFVEFGTYKDAPQPFMTPAADESRASVVAAMISIYRSAVGR